MASLLSLFRSTGKPAAYLLCGLLAVSFLGMGNKPQITVRFFAEAKAMDTERFAQPITFRTPPRQGYIERIPSIHEKHIKSVYPFQATDGSWGCAFQLDPNGRLALEVVSTERRGTYLVAFAGTKTGVHQVVELLIDKPITDGLISIPSGLTELEIAAITKAWPVIGAKRKK